MRRFNHSEKLLLLAPVLALGLPLMVHQLRTPPPETKPDAIEQEARRLAGSNAVDCGRTFIDHFVGDSDAVAVRGASNSRAFSAHKVGQSFLVIHDDANLFGWGTNPIGGTTRHQAIVGTPQGQLYLLSNSSGQTVTSRVHKKLCTRLFYAPARGFPVPQLQCK